jgi:hypothetical protein
MVLKFAPKLNALHIIMKVASIPLPVIHNSFDFCSYSGCLGYDPVHSSGEILTFQRNIHHVQSRSGLSWKMIGYLEEFWGGQNWTEKGMTNGGAVGNIYAVKGTSQLQEKERNVKTYVMKELYCFHQDVNKWLLLPAQEEIIFLFKLVRMEFSCYCFPDEAY